MILELILAAAAAQAAPAESGKNGEECVKPALLKVTNVSATQMSNTVERAQEYINCMSKAIDVQREEADRTLQVARAEAEKTNAMITDVNTFIKDVKKYQEENTAE